MSCARNVVISIFEFFGAIICMGAGWVRKGITFFLLCISVLRPLILVDLFSIQLFWGIRELIFLSEEQYSKMTYFDLFGARADLGPGRFWQVCARLKVAFLTDVFGAT